jgi:hypothetical protein
MTPPTAFPLRGQAARLEALRDVLRAMETANMTPGEVVTACQNAVPDATIDEIVSVLRQTAGEHIEEADRGEAELQRRRELRA